MNIGNQIEEMAQAILEVGDNYDTCCEEDCITIASLIYDKGYRKADEVVEEIFAELEKAGIFAYRYPIIAELKKKYIAKDTNVTTNTEERK